MQCHEHVLKCNKCVHLPARVSFSCVLGDLSAIWAESFASIVNQSALSPDRAQITYKSPTNHPKHTRKTLKRVSEHIYCISVHVRGIA